MSEDRITRKPNPILWSIGLVVSFAGILFGLSVGGFSAMIMLGYWHSENTEGRLHLTVTVGLALLIGYGVYRVGRRISR